MQQSDQWSKGSKQNPSTIQTCWTCLNHSSSLWRFFECAQGCQGARGWNAGRGRSGRRIASAAAGDAVAAAAPAAGAPPAARLHSRRSEHTAAAVKSTNKKVTCTETDLQPRRQVALAVLQAPLLQRRDGPPVRRQRLLQEDLSSGWTLQRRPRQQLQML